MILLASTLSWAMFVLGVTLLIAILLRRQLSYQRRAKRSEPSSIFTAPAKASNPPVEFTRWEVEMHETARALKAELDTKISALQALIIEARQQAERLEQALGRTDQPSADRLAPGTDVPLVQQPHPDQRPRSPSNPSRHAALPVNDGCRDQIYALADVGFSPERISQQVPATVGEVEMVLHLRQAFGGRGSKG